jgi:membrane protease YdiL (CAAX protease family)
MSVFMGPHGLRAGWRFLLFLFIAAIVAALLSGCVHFVERFAGHDAGALLGNFVLVASVLLAMRIMALVEGRPVWSYGFAAPNTIRNLSLGLVSGIGSLSVLMGVLVAIGAYKPGPAALQGTDALRWALYWAILFLGVGLSEESLMRSYPLFSLTQGIGFWPAAVILSMLFGAGHLGNNGEEWIGIANAFVVGLVLAYSVKWTGSLWWAIGYHMTWDWGESFFYGVADSGSKARHHFLSFEPAGAGWLSGGSVGPEGSAIATIAILLLAVLVRFTTPRWKNPGLEPLPRFPHMAQLSENRAPT